MSIIISASILATIVTVAVLAGIGLIPQKSPGNFNTEGIVGSESVGTSSDVFVSSTSPDSVAYSSTEINTPPSLPEDATYGTA